MASHEPCCKEHEGPHWVRALLLAIDEFTASIHQHFSIIERKLDTMTDLQTQTAAAVDDLGSQTTQLLGLVDGLLTKINNLPLPGDPAAAQAVLDHLGLINDTVKAEVAKIMAQTPTVPPVVIPPVGDSSGVVSFRLTNLNNPPVAQSGVKFSFELNALDATGNVVAGYTGKVHFTVGAGSPAATLPDDYTFVSDDHGVHQFGMTFRAIGTAQIIATSSDPNGLTLATGSLTVVVGA